MATKRQPKAEDIQELVAFLPKLHAEDFTPTKRWHTHNGDGTPTLPWVEYDETLESFVNAIVTPGCWMDQEYIPEEAARLIENESTVKSATLPQIQIMLTYFVRGERFCEGFQSQMIKDGHIRRLLERLSQFAFEPGGLESRDRD